MELCIEEESWKTVERHYRCFLATEYFTHCLMVFETGKWNDVGTKCAPHNIRFFAPPKDSARHNLTSVWYQSERVADATATEQWWWKQIKRRAKEHQPSTIKRSTGKSNKNEMAKKKMFQSKKYAVLRCDVMCVFASFSRNVSVKLLLWWR